MYTEIKELVNYLVPFLFNKIPRRKVITFAEQLANTLLFRFKDKWNDSSSAEYNRVILIRIVMKTLNGLKETTDRDVLVSAKSVGIDLDELLKFLPEGVAIHINPGEVLYSLTNSNSTSTHLIWNGSPDADRDYRPVTSILSSSSDDNDESIIQNNPDNYVALKLTQLNCEKDINRMETVFISMSRHSNEYTVEQFSVTRFGSHRARPDHEVMKRIQRQAAFEALAKSSIVEASSVEDSILSDNSSLLSNQSRSPNNNNSSSALDILKSMNMEQRQVVMRLLSDARNGHSNLDGVISALSDCSIGNLSSSIRPFSSIQY